MDQKHVVRELGAHGRTHVLIIAVALENLGYLCHSEGQHSSFPLLSGKRREKDKERDLTPR